LKLSARVPAEDVDGVFTPKPPLESDLKTYEEISSDAEKEYEQ
jgi:hypothetical protein